MTHETDIILYNIGLALRLGDISVFSCRYGFVVQRYDYRLFCKKIKLSFMYTQPFTVRARIRSSRTWTSNVLQYFCYL